MKRSALRAALAGALVMLLAGMASAGPHSAWGPAHKIDTIVGNHEDLNTPYLDGCPIQSPDGLSLYMASNRPNGQGLLDIWVAHRASTTDGFGAPVNLRAPVNSTANDFCPTPVRGGGLLFVSNRAVEGACGGSDIYFTRFSRRHGWRQPQHLACGPTGPNSPMDEQGPSYVEVDGRGLLYFSSGPDIYVSERAADGSFGPASPVAELNTGFSDIQPNVRKDGLEVVFASNRRAGTDQDIYTATRESIDDPFSTPVSLVNLGSAVNTTTGSETRPSLSWDGTQLLFGWAPGEEGPPPQPTDIYVTTREETTGSPG
jgi:WD40-like Beta Propeller Repeat